MFQSARREYLSLEELNILAKTPCDDILKRAALFSALTGMRHSDIQKLKWSEVEEYNGGYRLNFTQQKTKGVEYMPISPQAYKLCGERKKDGELLVFAGLPDPSWISRPLERWVKASGITKHITFHSGSHSKLFYLLNISELSILKNVTANDLETSYILFLSQLCNIQRTL